MASRKPTPLVRALGTATALAVSSCAGGPAGFCGWIGTDVEGLQSIAAQDGTRSVGTWYHVFAEGVTDADAASRRNIATAAAADAPGYNRLREQAPTQDVRQALDRLYALVQNPEEASAHHTDQQVRQDVDLIDNQGCAFLRQP